MKVTAEPLRQKWMLHGNCDKKTTDHPENSIWLSWMVFDKDRAHLVDDVILSIGVAACSDRQNLRVISEPDSSYSYR